MCHLTDFKIADRTVQFADIKLPYIENLVSSIALCPAINRGVLFGSAAEERCTELSDIDIAVFGSESKSIFFISMTESRRETAS